MVGSTLRWYRPRRFLSWWLGVSGGFSFHLRVVHSSNNSLLVLWAFAFIMSGDCVPLREISFVKIGFVSCINTMARTPYCPFGVNQIFDLQTFFAHPKNQKIKNPFLLQYKAYLGVYRSRARFWNFWFFEPVNPVWRSKMAQNGPKWPFFAFTDFLRARKSFSRAQNFLRISDRWTA